MKEMVLKIDAKAYIGELKDKIDDLKKKGSTNQTSDGDIKDSKKDTRMQKPTLVN